MKGMCEDTGWIATSIPSPSLSEKDPLLDYCQIFMDITMATIDMKTNISLDTSASMLWALPLCT